MQTKKMFDDAMGKLVEDIIEWAEDNHDPTPMHSQSNDGDTIFDTIQYAVRHKFSGEIADVIHEYYHFGLGG